MELKIESGTVSLTTEDTAEGLLQALKAIARRYGDVSGQRDGTSDLPIVPGLAWAITATNGIPEICVRGDFGWVVCQIPHAQVTQATEALRAVAKPGVA